MDIVLKEHKTLEGKTEYLLVGFEAFDDFAIVVRALSILQFTPNDELDGIWWQKAKYVLASGEPFELVYHEEAGTFAYANNQSEAANHELRQLLERLIEYLRQDVK